MKKHMTKDGREVAIRLAVESDANSTIRFGKRIFGLPTVLTTLEEFDDSLEAQTNWIAAHAKHDCKLILVAVYEGEVVGLLDFSNHKRVRIKHTGEFGVSVLPEFQNQGIARALILTLLEWAKENPSIEKVMLKVSSNNPKAMALYHSLGFQTEGRVLKEIKLEDDTYLDSIIMGQFV